ncbi:hypothetical protein ACFLZG_07605, partial [Thermodesulfobacteriota bacterium]
VIFEADSFGDSGDNGNVAETETFTIKETSAILAGPANGSVIDVTGLNNNKSVTVMFIPAPGNKLDETSVDDSDVVFTLTLPDNSKYDIAGPGTVENGSAYRYDLPGNLVFNPGDVTVSFHANTWTDTGGNPNVASIETFTVAGAAADLYIPVNGGAIDAGSLNEQGYLDVKFIPSGNGVLNADSILDPQDPSGAEFTLTGDAANGVIILNDQVSQIDGTTVFRYPFSGTFGTGEVQVEFIPGSFADSSYSNVADTEFFLVTGPTADIVGEVEDGVIGLTAFEQLRYVDITFTATEGNDIDVNSIDGDEIKFMMHDGNEHDPRGPPEVNGNTYRYFLPDSLTLEPGIIQVIFQPGTWSDTGGYTNLAETESFNIKVPTADLVDPLIGDKVDRATLNSRGYILVRFNDSTGNRLDASSVTDGPNANDNGSEFTLSGDGVGSAAVEGDAQKVKGELLFSTDDSGFSGGLDSGTFSDVLRQTFSDRNVRVSGSVTVTVMTSGSEWQVTDEGNLQYIIQYEAGEDGASDRIHVYDFNYTYQYNFSGSFVDGPVYVNFLAGRWQDNVGNTSLAETEYFGVISQAPSFEIMIEGSLELHGGGFTPDYNGDGTPDPLFSLRGKVVLNIDAVKHPVSGEILEARFTLDISATLELIYLGNVASAAGRFILVMGDANDSSEDSSIFGSNKLKFWGVLSFQTNLEKLRAIGIEANATALLMVNSTGETKIETISLEGIKGDKLFTMDDLDISSQLPQDLSPSSFIQEIPQALRDAFVNAGIEISENLQVQGVEPGTRWKIYDNDAGKQYFIDKDGNSLHIYGEAQRFELEGKSFSIALAGVLLFKIPPIQEDSPELFRLSGVFYMKIKLDGLDISLEAFVNAELTIGLESDPLLRFTALGVLLIRLSETESYFAMLLELEFNMGTSAI